MSQADLVVSLRALTESRGQVKIGRVALKPESARSRLRGGRGESGSVGGDTNTGGGADTGDGTGFAFPLTVVSRASYIDRVVDDSGDTIDQVIVTSVRYRDDNGVEFDWPTGET